MGDILREAEEVLATCTELPQPDCQHCPKAEGCFGKVVLPYQTSYRRYLDGKVATSPEADHVIASYYAICMNAIVALYPELSKDQARLDKLATITNHLSHFSYFMGLGESIEGR